MVMVSEFSYPCIHFKLGVLYIVVGDVKTYDFNDFVLCFMHVPLKVLFLLIYKCFSFVCCHHFDTHTYMYVYVTPKFIFANIEHSKQNMPLKASILVLFGFFVVLVDDCDARIDYIDAIKSDIIT